eukprot:CAMPEP_0116570026 /NCGR_PEP_ID=MMETSP0397-20121206/16694_1 /TAXON_ID=216820 /ORGANISM="Cyclophora tenuis, Strain ECT3854" /LENGTH=50 /DNA_ID=CAMNT_0004097803 /DNA_START=67 /DNA_END=219 /DNA_ORIENTATION=+
MTFHDDGGNETTLVGYLTSAKLTSTPAPCAANVLQVFEPFIFVSAIAIFG